VNDGENFAGKGNPAVVRETVAWPSFLVKVVSKHRREKGGGGRFKAENGRMKRGKTAAVFG
jgi:hypothetical protein